MHRRGEWTPDRGGGGLREDCKPTKVPCNVDAGVDERSDCKAGGACGDNTTSGFSIGICDCRGAGKRT